MEKLYKTRSETCLWQVNPKFWKEPLPKKKKLTKGKSYLPYSPPSYRFINNNFGSLVSSQEGDFCRLKECAVFRRRPSWHRRRFVLLEDELYCYEKREEALVFSEITMMSNVMSLTVQNSICLKISQVDGSIRMLRFSSAEVRNAWLTALLTAKAVNLLKYQ